ncbi:MAG TPA: hypothetical protein VFB62_27115 [Polyangiaceae bacterium]|jgi:hypothetical protein|nr:hypothetical protein [Polyangiaceae bacterium]
MSALGEEEEDDRASSEHSIDLDALLVALVLVPRSYPRNRFFGLYRFPPARRVRRRAAILRSLIADLTHGVDDFELERNSHRLRLRYRLIDVGATRTTHLSDQELALVKLGVERAHRTQPAPRPLPPALDAVDPVAREHLRHLLRRLYEE